MVVDHDVHREHARGRALAEDGRLHVDQREAVELLQLRRRDDADLDAERRDHRAVLGALHRAERDQRRGRALATEHRAQRDARRDAVGIRIRLQQDPDLLARREQLAHLDHAMEIREVIELVVEVVADQRAQAAEAQARVDRQIAGIEFVGEHEDRRDRDRLADGADRRLHEADLLADDAEDVALVRVELVDRLGRESALQRAKAGRAARAARPRAEPR